jgi:hypothetical protein
VLKRKAVTTPLFESSLVFFSRGRHDQEADEAAAGVGEDLFANVASRTQGWKEAELIRLRPIGLSVRLFLF